MNPESSKARRREGPPAALNGDYWKPLNPEQKRKRFHPTMFSIEDQEISAFLLTHAQPRRSKNKKVDKIVKSESLSTLINETESTKPAGKTASPPKQTSQLRSTKSFEEIAPVLSDSDAPASSPIGVVTITAESIPLVISEVTPQLEAKTMTLSTSETSVTTEPKKKKRKTEKVASGEGGGHPEQAKKQKKNKMKKTKTDTSSGTPEKEKKKKQSRKDQSTTKSKTKSPNTPTTIEETSKKDQQPEKEKQKKEKKSKADTLPTTTVEKKAKKKKEKKDKNSTEQSASDSSAPKEEKKKKNHRVKLDDALLKTDNMEGWSEARKRAYAKIHTNPNSYFYRFNAPGEVQKNGAWTEDERKLFFSRMEELGGLDYKWGIFSMTLPGRVGYQCSNFYRKLIKDGEIKDPNYTFDDKGEPVYIGKAKRESKEFVEVIHKEPEGSTPAVMIKSESLPDPKKMKQTTLLEALKISKVQTKKKSEKKKLKKKLEAMAKRQAQKQAKEIQKQKDVEDKKRRQEELEKFYEEDVKGKEVLPRLFVGNKRAAQNKEWLEENKVKFILNATREVSNFYEGELNYKRIAISDSVDELANKYFEEATSFIRSALDANDSSVLVHCSEGRSRSVTFTIAYLMAYEKWELKKAFEHLSSKSNININDGFKKQLMKYELASTKQCSINFFPGRRGSLGSSKEIPRDPEPQPNLKRVDVESMVASENTTETTKVVVVENTSISTAENTTTIDQSSQVDQVSLPSPLHTLSPKLSMRDIKPPAPPTIQLSPAIAISKSSQEELADGLAADPMFWGSYATPTGSILPSSVDSLGADENALDDWLNVVIQ